MLLSLYTSIVARRGNVAVELDITKWLIRGPRTHAADFADIRIDAADAVDTRAPATRAIDDGDPGCDDDAGAIGDADPPVHTAADMLCMSEADIAALELAGLMPAAEIYEFMQLLIDDHADADAVTDPVATFAAAPACPAPRPAKARKTSAGVTAMPPPTDDAAMDAELAAVTHCTGPDYADGGDGPRDDAAADIDPFDQIDDADVDVFADAADHVASTGCIVSAVQPCHAVSDAAEPGDASPLPPVVDPVDVAPPPPPLDPVADALRRNRLSVKDNSVRSMGCLNIQSSQLPSTCASAINHQ
jgi:hypothetical protein